MHPSTLSSLFTLSLILISHVPLRTNGADMIEAVCTEATTAAVDKARCLQFMNADPRIALAKDYVQLSKLILEIGLKKAKDGQAFLKELMKTNPSPAIKECATNHYNGVVGSFWSSLGEIVEDSQTCNYDAKVAGDGPVTCNALLADAKLNIPEITTLNSEISMISVIAFLATNKLPPPKTA